MATLLTLGGVLMLASCALFRQDRVVFVDQRKDLIRLDDDVYGHGFIQDETGKWVRTAKKIKYPAGLYVGSLDEPVTRTNK